MIYTPKCSVTNSPRFIVSFISVFDVCQLIGVKGNLIKALVVLSLLVYHYLQGVFHLSPFYLTRFTFLIRDMTRVQNI